MKYCIIFFFTLWIGYTSFGQHNNLITYQQFCYTNLHESKMLVLYSDSIFKYITKKNDDSISHVSYGTYSVLQNRILLTELPKTRLISVQEYRSCCDTTIALNILNAKGRPYALVDSIIIEGVGTTDTIADSSQDLNVAIFRETTYCIPQNAIKKILIKTYGGNWIECDLKDDESTRIDIMITNILVAGLENEYFDEYSNKEFFLEGENVKIDNCVFYKQGSFVLQNNEDTYSVIGREPIITGERY